MLVEFWAVEIEGGGGRAGGIVGAYKLVGEFGGPRGPGF